jgi:hypothetical protein
VDAGCVQRGKSAGVAEEKNDILGVLLSEQGSGRNEKEQEPGEHFGAISWIFGAGYGIRTRVNQLGRLTPNH